MCVELGWAGGVCESSRTVKGEVQNNTLNCLECFTTRAGMRIVRVRAMPGRVFASKGMTS